MEEKYKIHIINFLLFIVIIISANVIASQFFYQWDLTEEKRHTLSDQSKILLKQINKEVFIEVFLEGDLPPGFDRLQKSVKQILDEFRQYSGANIQYSFIDPNSGKNEAERSRYFMQLAKRGLQPTNLHASENGKQSEKIIFPGAIITYKGKEVPVQLLTGNQGSSPSEMLNQSVEALEYQFVSAFKKVVASSDVRIGFTEGHGELSNEEIDDIARSLKETYQVERINPSAISNLNDYYDILIFAKPTRFFNDDDKLKIDQFIIKGGKAIFFLDKTNASMEGYDPNQSVITDMNLNLDDMLFKYGVRLNSTIVKDMQCSAIPMVVGMLGDKPQNQLVPWMYYPILTRFGTHVSVKNMSAVISKFTGSIDTIKVQGIQKIPLIYTSQYSKEQTIPFKIELEEAKKQLGPDDFNKSQIPVAYLLIGQFKSLYTNRLSAEKQRETGFEEKSRSSKIMVFADGDIIRNEVSPDKSQAYPLGFDKYLRKKFANKELIQNCIDYMADENGIIQARSRQIKLRPLDKQKAKKDRLYWQTINIAFPLILLIGFGIFYFIYYKKRYAS
ncbi:MAG: gliding motility-associated ABC transporter substrate-binding protein GldG [Bacteroidota bacterium]|nr:gliding motility-associated ABC transporter substrate-binding protein GldG [Bacteroidota bacterium]